MNCFLFSARIDESEADQKERLAKWQTYLENEEAKREMEEENQQSDETAAATTENLSENVNDSKM